jgi:hypothetical protein
MCLHEFEFYSLDMIVLLPHSGLSAGRGMLHVIEWQHFVAYAARHFRLFE